SGDDAEDRIPRAAAEGSGYGMSHVFYAVSNAISPAGSTDPFPWDEPPRTLDRQRLERGLHPETGEFQFRVDAHELAPGYPMQRLDAIWLPTASGNAAGDVLSTRLFNSLVVS